ncbi:MAG: flagellar basal body P-ring protein FlgI [Phycisphaerales bacterium]|nr:flagellar basal body P-ring protein FlgI [Phycisphaerales bacterium]
MLFRCIKTVLPAVLVGTLLVTSACSSGPRPRPVQPTMAEVRDVPSVLRNIVRTETTMRGVKPTLVSGYGFVVDLNGTGSSDVSAPVRAIIEEKLIRAGVGTELGGAFRDITPAQLIESRDTAIVLVQAVVAPGAPAGSRFDVDVQAIPGTSTTSLQGGRLYTTQLFPGLAQPLSPDVPAIAEARGDIFINPFVDPAAESQSGQQRRRGRILHGGVVTDPAPIALFLDNPSHSRSRAIVEAINARFPRMAGRLPTASGIDEEVIQINIPPSYSEDPREFVELLSHTRIDQGANHRWAARYVEALKETPELATTLTWCLQALGDISIPYVRKLYDYGEMVPRLAALQAGARLGDPTTRPYLEEIATLGPSALRHQAIGLLGELPPNPSINVFLRTLLDAEDSSDRIAAYEALDARHDPWVSARVVDDKFLLIHVPSKRPFIYVTQQREPRVVLFGDEISVQRPVFVSAWDGRLLLNAESADARKVDVFYKDYRTGRITTGQSDGNLVDMVQFFAHESTPEDPRPGLNLSYSEVVGALYAISRQQVVRSGDALAVFIPEQDRLAKELLSGAFEEYALERPETAGGEWTEEMLLEARPEEDETETRPEGERPNYVVPLRPATPPPAESGGGSGGEQD